MLLGEQVVGQGRGVRETLHRGVEEAGVAQVVEACPHPVHALPLQGQPVALEQDLLRGRDAVTLASVPVLRDCGGGKNNNTVT